MKDDRREYSNVVPVLGFLSLVLAGARTSRHVPTISSDEIGLLEVEALRVSQPLTAMQMRHTRFRQSGIIGECSPGNERVGSLRGEQASKHGDCPKAALYAALTSRTRTTPGSWRLRGRTMMSTSTSSAFNTAISRSVEYPVYRAFISFDTSG